MALPLRPPRGAAAGGLPPGGGGGGDSRKMGGRVSSSMRAATTAHTVPTDTDTASAPSNDENSADPTPSAPPYHDAAKPRWRGNHSIMSVTPV